MENKRSNSPDVREHVHNIQQQFTELKDHLRDDISKINDPQGKALFEVSAEVIGGLQKAFTDFEKKNEEAWRGQQTQGR
jgi:hypothetical protein